MKNIVGVSFRILLSLALAFGFAAIMFVGTLLVVEGVKYDGAHPMLGTAVFSAGAFFFLFWRGWLSFRLILWLIPFIACHVGGALLFASHSEWLMEDWLEHPTFGTAAAMAFSLSAFVNFPMMIVYCFFVSRKEGLKYVSILFPPIAFVVAVWAPLFVVGIENTASVQKREELEVAGDRPSEKAPQLIDAPACWRELCVRRDGKVPVRCETNSTPAVVNLFTPEYRMDEKESPSELFASYASAIEFAKERKMTLLPSVTMAQYKAKTFGDSFLAALESHMQHEAAVLGKGKQSLLLALLDAAMRRDDGSKDFAYAIAYLAVGLELGNAEVPALSKEVAALCKEIKAGFLNRREKSKVVGFYAENPELSRIFQQDRFFQYGVHPAAARVLARILAEDSALRERYLAALAVNAKLCNPPAAFSLADALALSAEHPLSELKQTEAGRRISQRYSSRYSQEMCIALLPYATSRENELFDALYRDDPGLPAENVMNRLIRGVRSGEVNLTPQEDSGWYDYQSYAFETLLLPERAQETQKLAMSKGYKRHLIEAFRTLLTQEREKHIKLIPPIYTLGDAIEGGGRPNSLDDAITIELKLSVEPTATCYLRTARAFRFVRTAMAAELGADEFASIRLYNGDGLAEAASQVEDLFYGLYLRVCEDIGMKPSFEAGEIPDERIDGLRQQADAWLAGAENDAFCKKDVRAIVPVLTSPLKKRSRYWMTIGIRLIPLDAMFGKYPLIRVSDPDSGQVLFETKESGGEELGKAFKWFDDAGYRLQIKGNEYFIPVEVFAEGDGPATPPTREEFRKLCDSAKTQKEILNKVEHFGDWKRYVLAVAIIAVAAVILWKAGKAGLLSKNNSSSCGDNSESAP